MEMMFFVVVFHSGTPEFTQRLEIMGDELNMDTKRASLCDVKHILLISDVKLNAVLEAL